MTGRYEGNKDSSPAKGKKSAGMRVVTAIFLGILVNIVYLSYLCNTDGYKATMDSISRVNTQQYESLSGKKGDHIGDLFISASNRANGYLSAEYSKIYRNTNKVTPQGYKKKIDSYQVDIDKIEGVMGKALLIVKESALSACLKVVCLASGALLFLMASLLGALEGLSARYVRTQESGRESTFVFHHVTNRIIQVPAFLVFMYLITPIWVGQEIFIVALGFVMFLFFYIATRNLKKFL